MTPKPTLASIVVSSLLVLALPAQGRGGGGGGGSVPAVADFVGLASGSHYLKAMNADGSGLRTVVAQSCFGCQPSLSPDGRQIAYARVQGGVSALWVVNVDGTGMRAVTTVQVTALWSTGTPMRPVWSPVPIGGHYRLLFTDVRGGMGVHQLFVVNADGSGRQQLTDEQPWGVEPYEPCEWSPDATRIAYLLYGTSETQSLVVAGVAESGGALGIVARTLLPDVGLDPVWFAWANHGSWLLLSDEHNSLHKDLWLLDVDNPLTPVRLTNTSSVDERTPTFSADDSKVFFTTAQLETWVRNTDGSGQAIRFSNKLYYAYHRRG